MGNVVFFLLGVFVGLWAREQGLHHLLVAPTGRATGGHTANDADDMTQIRGIGPAFAEALHALGIQTYAELARQDADDLGQRISALGRVSVTPERIRREGWVEQAADLSRQSPLDEARR